MIIASLTKWERALSVADRFRCVPVNPSELADAYWTTATKAIDLVKAFGLNIFHSRLNAHVGPARLVGCDCKQCGGPLLVYSRIDAGERICDILDGTTEPGAEWASRIICRECREKMYRSFIARHEAIVLERRQRERDLRYMPYAEYLRSPEWKARAARARREAGYKCQVCSSGGELHVHHRTYVRRGSESAKDLTVLCASCHELFHANGRLADSGRAA